MPTKMNFIVPSSEDEVVVSNNIVTINGAEYGMGANDILLVPDEGGSSVDLSNYVTLDGDQTISGNKTFSSNVQFGSVDVDATTPPLIVNSTYGYIALGEVDLDSYATKLTFSERGMEVDYFGRYIKYPYYNYILNLPEPQSGKTHTLATREWINENGYRNDIQSGNFDVASDSDAYGEYIAWKMTSNPNLHIEAHNLYLAPTQEGIVYINSDVEMSNYMVWANAYRINGLQISETGITTANSTGEYTLDGKQIATQEWVQSQGSNGGTKYYRHNFVLFVPADTDYGTEEATYTFGAILSHSEPIENGDSFKNFLPKIMSYDQLGDAYFTEGIGVTSNGGYAGIFYLSVYGNDTFDAYIRILDSGETSAHNSFSSISITDNVVEL